MSQSVIVVTLLKIGTPCPTSASFVKMNHESFITYTNSNHGGKIRYSIRYPMIMECQAFEKPHNILQHYSGHRGIQNWNRTGLLHYWGQEGGIYIRWYRIQYQGLLSNVLVYKNYLMLLLIKTLLFTKILHI